MSTVDALLKQTNAMANGQTDGASNLPEKTATNYSNTESHIINLCQAGLSKREADVRQISSAEMRNIDVRAEDLPLEFTSIILQSRTEMDQLGQGHLEELRDTGLSFTEQFLDYRLFRRRHKRDFEPNYARSYGSTIVLALFLIIGGFAANVHFFDQAANLRAFSNPGIAFVISLTNFVAGFVAGVWPLRYLAHIRRWHWLWAFPLFVGTIGLAGVLNLMVGLYRDYLARDPSVLFLEIFEFTQISSIKIGNFESLLLIIIGFMIFLVALYKGYTVFGTYPGYASKHRAYKEAQNNHRVVRESIRGELAEIGKRHIESINKIVVETGRIAKDVNAANHRVQDAASQYLNFRYSEQETCNSAIRIYRNENMAVRTKKAPRYFDLDVIFSDEIDFPELRHIEMKAEQLQSRFETIDKDADEARAKIMEHTERCIESLERMIEDAESYVREQVSTENHMDQELGAEQDESQSHM